jgi:DNA-directed RNA polymerase specialized sigma24 family protein
MSALVERFWAKVDQSNPTACWPWTAATVYGYGTIQCGTFANPRMRRAHRVAYELTHGKIPAGLVVRHKCDVRACCNPAHLELGTMADNSRDMVERGRSGVGERNANARLTDAESAEIVHRYMQGGVSYTDLAAEFGVSFSRIGQLIRKARAIN